MVVGAAQGEEGPAWLLRPEAGGGGGGGAPGVDGLGGGAARHPCIPWPMPASTMPGMLASTSLWAAVVHLTARREDHTGTEEHKSFLTLWPAGAVAVHVRILAVHLSQAALALLARSPF